MSSSSVARGTGHNSSRRKAGSLHGATQLMYACQQGDVILVKQILKSKPKVLKDRDRTGKSCLHYCCTSDSVFAVQAADLVAMAAPDLVESRDEDGFTPLHLAVIAGNLQLVTFLLANKADVAALDNEKHTVVHWATVCGETGALRAVIEAGAPVSSPDVHGGYPLHYAAQMCGGDKGSTLGLQVLHTLLAQPDIDVTVEDGDGRQPLLWAASAGSARAVLALVRAGAKVEAPDRDGLTALHCAASRGHTDCIDTLLTLCGSSPDVIDSNGCTALHYAVTLGHADATALLLSHGSDANRQDRKGRSPAHCGCAKGQFETLKILSNHGANLWLRNAKGDLPLHEAAASGRRDLVRWLLDFRPSQVNARNNDGRCPLHLAALHDNPDMCKILLDIGAQINPVLRTSKNVFMTPLDCALQRGFRSTAKYLQLHGGVPASRLTGLKHPQNSASLQIREDITFWDKTSSENEEAEKDAKRSSRSRKKSYKRRTMVYEKKTAAADLTRSSRGAKGRKESSGSDAEDTAAATGGSDGKESKKKCRKKGATEKKDGEDAANKSISSGHEISFQHENGGIMIKSDVEISSKGNGVIIQRKDGICISGGKAKSVKENLESSLKDEITAKAKEAAEKSTLTAAATGNGGSARPKSARPGGNKARTKPLIRSPKTEAESPGSKSKSPKVTLVDKSVETVDNKVDEGTQSDFGKDETQTQTRTGPDIVLHQQLVINPDQQSLFSVNSTEESEAVRNLVVEAAVHPPPKDVSMNGNDDGRPKEDKTEAADAIKAAVASETAIDQTPVAVSESRLDEQALGKAPDSKIDSISTSHQTKDDTQEDKSANEELEKSQKSEEEAPAMVVLSGPEEVVQETDGKQKAEIEDENANEQERKREPSFIVVDDNKESATKSGDDQSDDKDEDGKQDAQISQDLSQSVTDTDNVSFETVINVYELAEKNKEVGEGDSSAIAAILLDNDQDVELIDGKTQPSLATILNEGDDAQTENRQNGDKGLVLVLNEKGSLESNAKSGPEDDEEEEDSHGNTSSSSQSSLVNLKSHKSFQVLEEGEEFFDNGIPKTIPHHRKFTRKSGKSGSKKPRSKSEDPKRAITGIGLKPSKSSSIEDERQVQSSMDGPVTTLPRIYSDKNMAKSETNISAAMDNKDDYSDNEGSGSEEVEEGTPMKIRRLKKRSKSKGPKSAGSDYESSNLIDSGFEPSPRSSRIPKKKVMSERGVNMTSVTQTIQSNIRRYHLERRIFQQLLDLKRIQIRSGVHNESVLVKRAIDAYHRSCLSTVGAGRYSSKDYTFKSFEKFLYEALRKLQKNGTEYLKGLPEAPDYPLLCTQSTHRCLHATHAYTGVPCAAYIPKMNHHQIPKVGFNVGNKTQQGFLPQINSKKGVTLELCHGIDKQVITLPAERLDQNKRYYVTFTVKGQEKRKTEDSNSDENAHRHAKSV